MMLKFEVVCPEADGKFSYYPMELDFRLIKKVSMATGGSLIEMITGQTIHVNEPCYIIEYQLQTFRANSIPSDEVHPDDL